MSRIYRTWRRVFFAKPGAAFVSAFCCLLLLCIWCLGTSFASHHKRGASLTREEMVPLSHTRVPRVVIAMAAYQDVTDIVQSAFVWSLRCAGYEDDIVLILTPEAHHHPSPKLKSMIDGFRVTTRALENPPADLCAQNHTQTGRPIDVRCLAPEFSRFYWYHQALQSYTDNTTRVLLSDFRDVIFQADPFSLPEALTDQLTLFSEFPGEPIGASFWTTMWIEKCFGKNAARLLFGRRCAVRRASGVRVSASISIYNIPVFQVTGYVDTMMQALGALGMKEECRDLGMDQGFHNYLAHTGVVQGATIRGPGESTVHTIGRFCSGPSGHESVTKIDEETSVVLNDDGSPAPMVHQIDRCKAPHYHRRRHESHLRSKCPLHAAEALESLRTMQG